MDKRKYIHFVIMFSITIDYFSFSSLWAGYGARDASFSYFHSGIIWLDYY